MAGKLRAKQIGRMRPGRHGDGGTLFLVVEAPPSGSRHWVQRLTVNGRRRDIGLGGWPFVGLAEARDRAFVNRQAARRGGDPVPRAATVPTFRQAAAKVEAATHWAGRTSESRRVAFATYCAAILDRRMHRINEVSYSLFPVAVVAGFVAGLIMLEPDFGTAATILMIVGVMVFTAGLSYRYLVSSMLAMMPILYFVLASAPYRRQRLLSFLDPWHDPLDSGFQVIQSLIAVGTGGVFGQGIMGGVQKLFFLPEPFTDFIYAVIAEETGLVGATLILFCFGAIAWRGFRVAALAPDRFGAILAVGLTTLLILQAFLNISVVLSLVPTKGTPLPFVSHGGSSMLASLLAMGVLLNISQHTSAEA